MDVLEKEILKYEKKGFKIDHKRTLKYGLRKVLLKKGGWLGTDTIIYFYYVDGDASTDSFREFFKDYERFYEDNDLDPNARASLLPTRRLISLRASTSLILRYTFLKSTDSMATASN